MNLRSITTRAGVAVALILAPLMIVAQATSASPTTLYVGPSGTNVNNNCQAVLNPCQTITFALGQAPSGATIKVQAGTYDETLRISQPVTILGAGATQTVIEPTAVTSDADTDSPFPQFFVVDAANTAGVNLKDLGINGTAATASFDTDGLGCAQDFVGAYYHDASGSMANDTVTGIEMPADLFGCQGGLGVYAATDSGSASPSVLSMTSDNVNNYDKNGITCDDPGTSCTIKGTTVTGIGSTTAVAQNGIQIWAASGRVASNVIKDNTFDGTVFSAAGVLVGNPQTLTMTKNVVTDNDTNVSVIEDQDPAFLFCGNQTTSCTNLANPGTTLRFTANHLTDATNVEDNPVGSEFGDGLDIDSVSTATSLRRNVVDDNSGNGISLLGASNLVATANTARNDDNGFFLSTGTTGVTANANTVRRSTVSSSLNDGFLVDASSGENTFLRNNSQLNADFDAADSSTGTGTAGTNDSWEANNCSTSDPSGLCHTAATRRLGAAAHTAKRRAPTTAHRARHALFR
jgi:hypothetical protein